MKYPCLVEYIRGMYEESGAKEGGWTAEEIITDLMRFPTEALAHAEEGLSMFGPKLAHDMGYYNLTPREMDEGMEVAVTLAEELAA